MERTTRNAIVVRVPAERFEEALGEIEKLGPVPEREIVAQDVTEEYTDLKLRLANARKLRDKLTALLDRAENIQDILAIEKELSRVTGEIERLEGRLNKLKHQVAFSKISVAFARYENAPAGWRSQLPFHWLRTLGVENLLNLN
jgi:hypothetical protein